MVSVAFYKMLKYVADSGWKSIHKFKYSGRTFELSVITVVFLKEKILCPVELNMFGSEDTIIIPLQLLSLEIWFI